MVTVSGTQANIYCDGETCSCPDPGTPVPGSQVSFTFHAPVTKPAYILDAPDNKLHSYIEYSACYCDNSPNKTYQSGLGPCPGSGCS